MAHSNANLIVSQYLSEIEYILKSGDAREHAYRPAFQKLIEALKPDIQVINEPAYTGGNAPDFLFKKGGTPIAYAECKDVTVDVTHKDVQKQAQRYVEAFGRILLTNYYDFEIISESGEVKRISIAEKTGSHFQPKEENFEPFANLIADYITPEHRTITSAKKLAEIMASKARLLRDNALASLSENPNSDIHAQYVTFKQVLIHDLDEKEFADMYAQTIVYGLFVARYFDSSMPTFSRHEAQDLLPSTNPLLKKFFGHVAGTDYDPKIAWLVDSLIGAYLSADVAGIMHQEFQKKQKDPVLHFYETFLTEYDKDLRKNRGVYYTPISVVSFIVRSVDQILKTKFNLPKGLRDETKVEYKEKISESDGRTKDGIKQVSKPIHKVQILDPAVGTGTFLNEVIHEIYKTFKGQEGVWPSYAKEHLLPRLHGFELMMASYTMAHLKLGVTLKELGYEGHERLSVWLTNSLEEGVHEVRNLFMSQWLTEESNEASKIKSDLPIMVVLGNPPYSVSSANKGESIQNLIKVYKENLNEKKINLDDDYIKFIRFAEHEIEKTGYGVVAMITNNSFIDGVTHRQMRKHLMETFDEIYILDLHGNAKKKETAPDGGKDENVFSIMQGVSINLFIKNKQQTKNAPLPRGDAQRAEEGSPSAGENAVQAQGPTVRRTKKWEAGDFDPAFYAHSENAIPYLKSLISRARENRKAGNPVENKMWYGLLANRQLNGYKFSRQKPLFTYIADFYCSELGLVVELDGDSHIGQEEYDQKRTEELEQFGLTVIRYANAEVMGNLEGVREDLLERMEKLKGDPPTPLEGGAKGKGGHLATVYHAELFGKQEEKYAALEGSSFETMQWKELKAVEPYYFFVPKDFEAIKNYERGFKVTEFFQLYGPGVKSERDSICINNDLESLEKIISDFEELEENQLLQKYNLYDSRDWKVKKAKQDIFDHSGKDMFQKVLYRPFDYKWTWYSGQSRGFIGTPGNKVGKNMLRGENTGLITNRQIVSNEWTHAGLTKTIISHGTFYLGNKGQDYLFPLYLYHEDGSKTPNLNPEIIQKIEKKLGLSFSSEESFKKLGIFDAPPVVKTKLSHFSPEDILDYIYAVLHSPSYRDKYKEFLKIDFPRVPYPTNKETFWKLVELGRELRGLHLLESQKVHQLITTFPVGGSNKVESKYPNYKEGKVYINENQYFGSVPEVAWNFYIGGYQPAQKWLKDRRGRELSVEDIEHYQQMIVALTETGRIMEEVDAFFIIEP